MHSAWNHVPLSCSFVHGRLPYDWLKTDHTLKNLLHSVPIRKVVSSPLWVSSCLKKWKICYLIQAFDNFYVKQIFSNGNEAHVAKVLSRLGLEDCFEDIVCFETLNPTKKSEEPENSCDGEFNRLILKSGFSTIWLFHVFCYAPELPKTPILCKPFENAFEQAFKIAGINPHKTVRKVMLQCLDILIEDQIHPLSFVCSCSCSLMIQFAICRVPKRWACILFGYVIVSRLKEFIIREQKCC